MRLTDANVSVAKEIIGRYPKAKSALIPLLHLAQEQNGHLTDDVMTQIGDLVGCTSAEVWGTASFYEMFKFDETGKYLINICRTLSCALMGGEELMRHAEQTLGVRPGGTTADGMFTLADAECQAACTEAPCLQVNYRYRYRVTPEMFDELIAQLRDGALNREIPAHGTLARVRQSIPTDRGVGAREPDTVTGPPEWVPVTPPSEATS